jgi:hypothetical protein
MFCRLLSILIIPFLLYHCASTGKGNKYNPNLLDAMETVSFYKDHGIKSGRLTKNYDYKFADRSVTFPAGTYMQFGDGAGHPLDAALAGDAFQLDVGKRKITVPGESTVWFFKNGGIKGFHAKGKVKTVIKGKEREFPAETKLFFEEGGAFTQIQIAYETAYEIGGNPYTLKSGSIISFGNNEVVENFKTKAGHTLKVGTREVALPTDSWIIFDINENIKGIKTGDTLTMDIGSHTITFAKDAVIHFDIRGNVESIFVEKDQTLSTDTQSYTFPKESTVHFDPKGNIKGAFVKSKFRISEGVILPAETSINVNKDGTIENAFVIKRCTIKFTDRVITMPSNVWLHFNQTGSLKSVGFVEDTNFLGNRYKKNSVVEFDGKGNIKE